MVEQLIDTIADDLGTMAMVNYPYNTSFVRPLPAWPVAASCHNASGVLVEDDTRGFDFLNIDRLAAMHYVWQGKDCLDLGGDSGGALDASGWAVQSCYELPMPQGNDPSQSAYTWTGWDEDAFTQGCKEAFGMTPQYDWALDFFGGREPRHDFLD